MGECIHCFVLKVGMETNPFVGSSILNMYAKLGDIEDLRGCLSVWTIMLVVGML